MTELKKVKLPNKYLTEEVIFKSLNASDIVNEHFSITDLPSQEIGTSADLPAATVVFDLSGSSLSIRNKGAKSFAAEYQYIFRLLTDIIYDNHGIVEKFPGDGISMHFPAAEFGKDGAIHNACKAIKKIDEDLIKILEKRDKYRFTLTYGQDTIITSFGSPKHLELISIGHAVNVAHKLEKIAKENACYLGIDSNCNTIASSYFGNLRTFNMPEELCRAGAFWDFWYGVEY